MKELDHISPDDIDEILGVLAEGYIQVWPDDDIDPNEVADHINRNRKVRALKTLEGKAVTVKMAGGAEMTGVLEVSQDRKIDWPYYLYHTYSIRYNTEYSKGGPVLSFTEEDVSDVRVAESGGTDWGGIVVL